jgi:hypothetical protein
MSIYRKINCNLEKLADTYVTFIYTSQPPDFDTGFIAENVPQFATNRVEIIYHFLNTAYSELYVKIYIQTAEPIDYFLAPYSSANNDIDNSDILFRSHPTNPLNAVRVF